MENIINYSKKPYWRSYYPQTNAVIYVIDSTDTERLDQTKEELLQLFEEEELKGVPLMILANKQDIKGALSEEDVTERMGLTNIKNRQWALFKCSAMTGQGLNEGMEWIVKKDYDGQDKFSEYFSTAHRSNKGTDYSLKFDKSPFDLEITPDAYDINTNQTNFTNYSKTNLQNHNGNRKESKRNRQGIAVNDIITNSEKKQQSSLNLEGIEAQSFDHQKNKINVSKQQNFQKDSRQTKQNLNLQKMNEEIHPNNQLLDQQLTNNKQNQKNLNNLGLMSTINKLQYSPTSTNGGFSILNEFPNEKNKNLQFSLSEISISWENKDLQNQDIHEAQNCQKIQNFEYLLEENQHLFDKQKMNAKDEKQIQKSLQKLKNNSLFQEQSTNSDDKKNRKTVQNNFEDKENEKNVQNIEKANLNENKLYQKPEFHFKKIQKDFEQDFIRASNSNNQNKMQEEAYSFKFENNQIQTNSQPQNEQVYPYSQNFPGNVQQSEQKQKQQVMQQNPIQQVPSLSKITLDQSKSTVISRSPEIQMDKNFLLNSEKQVASETQNQKKFLEENEEKVQNIEIQFDNQKKMMEEPVFETNNYEFQQFSLDKENQIDNESRNLQKDQLKNMKQSQQSDDQIKISDISQKEQNSINKQVQERQQQNQKNDIQFEEELEELQVQKKVKIDENKGKRIIKNKKSKNSKQNQKDNKELQHKLSTATKQKRQKQRLKNKKIQETLLISQFTGLKISENKREFKINKGEQTFGEGRYPKRQRFKAGIGFGASLVEFVEENDDYIVIKAPFDPEVNYKCEKTFKTVREANRYEKKQKENYLKYKQRQQEKESILQSQQESNQQGSQEYNQKETQNKQPKKKGQKQKQKAERSLN
ncbi:P-loop containing nucleoside triphosphate hydrolase [Pseudocohnilembus persalinus]|uniref:p-loop containing nucleoside triphosphate hydrolase n=1 Tax=Pseudocohnilembus persalinus TaxID=266149 RepID=A0A0V0QM69_PSEPJ|nr:P-loop containing nucleoside triphosphate hydrolase [Pseudocohnilembus persalinus]|eukprot:KRX03342.1 P-loop containing nucleoside triphosphate hydrolase [Pseudocohnilembus persalinus]